MKPWTDNAIAMRNAAPPCVLPGCLLDAITERRPFSWLPRAQKDRRQIESLASINRRIQIRRSA
jgi:hypothetical protein